MVSLASRDFRKVLRVFKSHIECLDLLLCTCVLPVWTERVTEGSFPLSLCTTLKLLEQRLSSI